MKHPLPVHGTGRRENDQSQKVSYFYGLSKRLRNFSDADIHQNRYRGWSIKTKINEAINYF